MESQPQNPKFRNNPENFHPCYQAQDVLMTLNRHGHTGFQSHQVMLCLMTLCVDVDAASY